MIALNFEVNHLVTTAMHKLLQGDSVVITRGKANKAVRVHKTDSDNYEITVLRIQELSENNKILDLSGGLDDEVIRADSSNVKDKLTEALS